MHQQSPLLDREEILCLEDCLQLTQVLTSLSAGQYKILCQKLELRLIWCLSRRFPSPESLSHYQEQLRRLRQALYPESNPSPRSTHLSETLSCSPPRNHLLD
jgi:hypothetical protein